MNFVQKCVFSGGKLSPIVIPHGLTAGTGLMNPSILIDNDGDILVNLRHVNYTLYHSENTQKFPSPWGPLAYLHPEQDQRLATENYICRLDKNFNLINHTRVQMLELHKPIWEFHGLEDCRIVQWEGNYYIIGVRRDTTENGQGRMEYSRIDLNKDNWTATEVSRVRIPAPGENKTYCEKNWMPILDKPYHFVKWSMPTEVVKADPNEPKTEQVILKDTPRAPKDQRGGSQVVKWGNYYITFTHEVDLWKNYLKQKDAIYRHRMIVWDQDFNFVGLTKAFSFLDARIEFAVGAAILGEDLLITFGFQDNVAFVLQVPNKVMNDLLEEALSYAN